MRARYFGLKMSKRGKLTWVRRPRIPSSKQSLMIAKLFHPKHSETKAETDNYICWPMHLKVKLRLIQKINFKNEAAPARKCVV